MDHLSAAYVQSHMIDRITAGIEQKVSWLGRIDRYLTPPFCLIP